MFVDKYRFVCLYEDTEWIEALYKTLNLFPVDEGNNNRNLFLACLIEELVLNIKYHFTHYNLLVLQGALFIEVCIYLYIKY